MVEMRFMDVAILAGNGAEIWVSRSGYTGEDGFEISIPAAEAERVARALLAEAEVKPIGLGARDSLRLEAGLCLYGHELTTEIDPVQAGLLWSISKSRRPDGARAASRWRSGTPTCWLNTTACCGKSSIAGTAARWTLRETPSLLPSPAPATPSTRRSTRSARWPISHGRAV